MILISCLFLLKFITIKKLKFYVQEPPVLAAIQEARIPSGLDAKGKPLHHKFNNSSFFAAKGDAMMDSFNKLFFSMGSQNFTNFFNDLHRMATT